MDEVINSTGILNAENGSNALSDVRVVLVDNSNIRLTFKQKIQQKRMWRYSLGYDKRYRGPLSLFALRVLAWICIVLSQVAVVLNLAAEPLSMPSLTTVSNVIQVFSSLSMPLFLLANFAYIIQNKSDVMKLLVTYFVMMIVVAGCFYLIYLHYGIGLYCKLFNATYEQGYNALGVLIMLLFTNTFKFNIFVDLFVCTLIVYFFLGVPKKYFKGKKIIIFRLLTILPLSYEIAVILLKIFTVNGVATIPFLMTPFLPTKCPMTFVAFIFIVLGEAKRKRKFYKVNGNLDNYEEYFKSKKNSWLFAKSAAKSFALIGIIDLILYAVFAILQLNPDETVSTMYKLIIDTMELGESAGLLLFAPFIFLFSYNKMFKPSKMDLFLPMLSIIAIVVIWLETIYQAILNLV